MNKFQTNTEVGNGIKKFDYKALVAEAKALGLDTKGKAAELDTRINEYHIANPPAEAAVEEKVERRGRPINPNSPRQIRLSQVNMGKRGRPADPNSAWNIKQAAIQAKKDAAAAEGKELKLGRMIDPNSARQKRLALKGTLPLGRPKAVVVEEPVVEAVDADAVAVLESMLDGGTEV